MDNTYDDLTEEQLRLLVSETVGAPHQRKKLTGLRRVFRSLSDEDQTAAFARNNIQRPGVVDAIIEEDDVIVGDVIQGPAAAREQTVAGLAQMFAWQREDFGGERTYRFNTDAFKRLTGEELIEEYALMVDKDKKAFGLTAVIQAKRNRHAVPAEKYLISLINYSLAFDLSAFNKGNPILSILELQMAYASMSFFLSIFYKEKVSKMSDLMGRFLQLWNKPGVSVGECVAFEYRIRLIISEELRDYCFEAVSYEFFMEWNDVRTGYLRVPPPPPFPVKDKVRKDDMGKKPCFNYNDGRSCAKGKSCEFGHFCMCCGKDHPSLSCSMNRQSRKALDIYREVKAGEASGKV
jgi:hypothetical protein